MGERELDDAACQELLRSATVGRVAVATPVGPDVVLVDFCVLELDGRPTLVLATTPYSVLDSADPAATVAFEVDDVAGGEWRYVVVHGRARPVGSGRTAERIRAAWSAPGRRRTLLILEMTHVNGRRVGTGL